MPAATDQTDTLFTLNLLEPEARLQIGSGDVPGVSASARDHVRLRAEGGRDRSDAVGQATGQLWLQAVSNAALLAKKKVMISAQGASWLAADRGINVIAGFRPRGGITSETSAGELPEGVEGYADSTEIVAGVWTGFTVALGVSVAAAKVAESVVGTQYSWSQSLGANLNLAGAALNLANLTGKRDVRLPGIGLWSEGGTRIASTFNSVNIMGVAGVTLASPFTSLFGLSSARVHAIQRVGLTSCGNVDISGLCGGSIKSFLSTSVAARTGALTLIGSKSMAVGVPNRPATGAPWPLVIEHRGALIPNPQQHTQSVQVSALRKASITSPGEVRLSSKGAGARITSLSTTTLRGAEVAAEAGGYYARVSSDAVRVGARSRLEVTERAAELLLMGAACASTLACDADQSITIHRAGAELVVQPATSVVSFNAPQLVFK